MKEISSSIPAHEQIAAVAYRLYLESGRQDGHEKEHWQRAEQLLNNPSAPARPAVAPQQTVKPSPPQKKRHVAFRHTYQQPAWLMAQMSRIF